MSEYKVKHKDECGATVLYDGQFIVAIAPRGISIVDEAEAYIAEAGLNDEEAEAVRAAVSLA